MIFQDPLSALNPVQTIGDQIAEAIHMHNDVSADVAFKRTIELLEAVGIPRPNERAKSYPHEFSGGMRQRVMIALAIANQPKVLLADEPTTALDVTVQAQILDVLKVAKEMTNAAIVLVTHDLTEALYVADRIALLAHSEGDDRTRVPVWSSDVADRERVSESNVLVEIESHLMTASSAV